MIWERFRLELVAPDASPSRVGRARRVYGRFGTPRASNRRRTACPEDEARRVLHISDMPDAGSIETLLNGDPWTAMRLLQTLSMEPWNVLLGGFKSGGKCRNRTYQPAFTGLSGFEVRETSQ